MRLPPRRGAAGASPTARATRLALAAGAVVALWALGGQRLLGRGGAGGPGREAAFFQETRPGDALAVVAGEIESHGAAGFTALELVDPSVPLTDLARTFPDCTWVAAQDEAVKVPAKRKGKGKGKGKATEAEGAEGVEGAEGAAGAEGTPGPASVVRVRALQTETLEEAARAPHLFRYLFALDYSTARDRDQSQRHKLHRIALLLTLAQHVYFRIPRAKAEQHLREIRAATLYAGVQAVIVEIRPKDDALMEVVAVHVTAMKRSVGHHFGDRRPGACEGASELFYEASWSAEGFLVPRARLCRLGGEPALGGGRGDAACACTEKNNATYALPATVGADLIGGLGVHQATAAKLFRGFSLLEDFGECAPWGVCVGAGGTVAYCDGRLSLPSSRPLKVYDHEACVRVDFGDTPACCIDLMLIGLHGCGYDADAAGRLDFGSEVDLRGMTACRKRHMPKGFSVDRYKVKTTEALQESFVFGSGLEPARMRKEDVLVELQRAGLVPPEKAKAFAKRSKARLAELLEEYRFDTSNLDAAEVTAQLTRLRLDASGDEAAQRGRLRQAKENFLAAAKRRTKLVADRQRLVAMIRGPQFMTKEELSKELELYGKFRQDTKARLAALVEKERPAYLNSFRGYVNEQNAALVAELDKAVTHVDGGKLVAKVSEMNKADIVAELRDRGETLKGNKANLVEKLLNARVRARPSPPPPPPPPPFAEAKHSKERLQERLRTLGLRTEGSKDELILRLREALKTTRQLPEKEGVKDLLLMSKRELIANARMLGQDVDEGLNKEALRGRLTDFALGFLGLEIGVKQRRDDLIDFLAANSLKSQGTTNQLLSRLVHEALLRSDLSDTQGPLRGAAFQ